jgi:hypothetical protein
MDKWKEKFNKAIEERKQFKKDFNKTQVLSCLTRNTNLKSTDVDRARGQSVEPSDKEGGSLFNKVLKRRKSRQSTFAPVNLDFDYAGNSEPIHHLILDRKEQG